MIITSQTSVAGASNRSMPVDIMYPSQGNALPVIIFCHGYKGFKDWGAWNLMASAFAKAGFICVKFNYSHNGGTLEQPVDFPDLEAFAQNNYTKEVGDTKNILDWLEQSELPYDQEQVCLIGHSRAGGITTIVAADDSRVKKLISLAGVADYEERFPQGAALEQWKEKGVFYVKNGRTNQDMPHKYQFYTDFIAHRDQLDILKQAASLKIPHLILHAMDDESVSVNDAHRLYEKSPYAQLRLFREGGHTFGTSHPWEKRHLPHSLRLAIQCSINFLKNT